MGRAPSQQLTPVPDGGYVHDLFLGRRSDGTAIAAWVQQDGNAESICWRVVGDGRPGPVRSIPAMSGHPSGVRVCADRLIWCELTEGQGALREARIDAAGELTGAARPIDALTGCNAGDVAVTVDGAGALWALVETWQAGGCRLRLLRDVGEGWQVAEGFPAPAGFCIRPRLAVGAGGAWASWDQYTDGRYRVAAARLSDGDDAFDLLPTSNDVWESLSAIAVAAAGRVFAARCRERRVDLNSSALFHSELVAAVRDGDGWRDVATIDIDFALNPWQAAYWGFRRFPMLFPEGEGVWLAWEEKIDPASMGPGPGRLCGQFVTADGPVGRPVVLLDNRCMFIAEQPTVGPRVRIATKTQWEGFEFHLPYELHTVDLAAGKQLRPAFLPSLGDEPTFTPRRAPGERPRMGACKLYFGDLHVHSHLSCDLPGEPDELYHFARDVASMDFVCFTENDATRFTEPLTPAAWEHSRRLAQAFNDPGRFTAFVGWEYTLHTSPKFPRSYDSHRSVVFPDFEARVVSWTDGQAPTAPDLAAAFAGERVLLHHHHGHDMDLSDEGLERNVEVASAWCDRPVMYFPETRASLHTALDRGLRLGLFAAGDVHERNPGLAGGIAGVWATDNTREAIFDAFWHHRVFATTGVRPDLRFEVSGAMLGSEVEVDEPPVVRLSVRCDVPVRRVEIVRDRNVVHEIETDEAELRMEWLDRDCPPGEHYYYAYVRFDGDRPRGPGNVSPAYGPDAWTSPVWVQRR